MSVSPIALATPTLLEWARESAGFSIERLAATLTEAPETIQAWEAGSASPTISQLKEFAKKTKRSLAVFYLPEPPVVDLEIRDFRIIGDDEEDLFAPSGALVQEFKRVCERQTNLREMLGKGIISKASELPAVDRADITTSAAKVREWLGISEKDFHTHHQPHDAYRFLRGLLEAKGIWVFQSIGVQVEDVRGFAIYDPDIPIVVVNGTDYPYARNFTLIHELGHLLLKERTVCDLKGFYDRKVKQNREEQFCNKLAVEVLMPKHAVRKEELVSTFGSDHAFELPIVKKLADRFGVSQEAMLIRLGELSLMEKPLQEDRLAELRDKNRRSPGPSGGDYYATVASRMGRRYIKTVVEALDARKITPTQCFHFLGRVKQTNIRKLYAQATMGSAREAS